MAEVIQLKPYRLDTQEKFKIKDENEIKEIRLRLTLAIIEYILRYT